MNEKNEGTYLVTGATGKVGGQVVRQLLDTGATNVRALVRDPSAARLPTGVEVVSADLAVPDSLDAALDGVTRVFLVWPTLRADAAAPEVLARITDRVRRVVYLSSVGAGDTGRNDPVNGSHARIERLIRDSGVEWTFVRGGGFAGNDLAWSEEVRTRGVVREAFAGWRRSMVHEADLAAVGVRALTTDDHVGAVYAVTGPEALDQADRVRIIGEVTGLDLRFEEQTPDEARAAFRSWLPEDAVGDTMARMATMTRVPEPVTSDVADVLGRPALPYRRWVADHLADFLPEAPRDGGEGAAATARVAAEYVEAVSRRDSRTVTERLFSPDFVRVAADDMTGPAVELRGDDLDRHLAEVGGTEEIHSVGIDAPLVRGDRFAVRFTLDSTYRPTGLRGTYAKISLYTVRDGRIVREEVFFQQSPALR